MAVEIKYQAAIENESISSYTHKWATKFDDMVIVSELTGDYGSYYFPHQMINRPTTEDFNSQKAAYSSFHENGAAIIFQGDLFGFGKPAVPDRGHIGNIEFGKLIIAAMDNPDMHLQDAQMKISGLDIKGDYYNSVCSMSRALNAEPENPYQGGAGQGVYNLLRGNADPMLDILKAQGIDVDTPLKDMVIASQYIDSAITISAPIIETTGSSESTEALSAA
ncbi:heme acquisition protein HasA [Yersinia rohdei]|uniref:heme acquisition protein HasA n=1 Tax=Yersinia rohdei TaxID=29485 RepID=UPI00119FEDF8|nr:heme acquisition protein HasA [Yersinia rohdei]